MYPFPYGMGHSPWAYMQPPQFAHLQMPWAQQVPPWQVPQAVPLQPVCPAQNPARRPQAAPAGRRLQQAIQVQIAAVVT